MNLIYNFIKLIEKIVIFHQKHKFIIYMYMIAASLGPLIVIVNLISEIIKGVIK